MADQGLLILSADKGASEKQQLCNCSKPYIARHGCCFSLPVNYHLINRFVENHGGRGWLPERMHQSICVAGFLLNMRSARETDRVFNDAISRFNPDDFFVLKKSIERNFSNMTVPEILAYVRLSAYDSIAFQRGCRAIKDQSLKLTPQEIHEITKLSEHVRENHYDLDRFDLNAEVEQLLGSAT